MLVQRDLAVKYQASVLGYVWSLIEPLSMGLIYWFVFGVLFDGRQGLGDGENYVLFILSGIFAWQWFSSALGESTTALTNQARLITTIMVPREIFPIGRTAGRFAEYLAGIPILIIAAIILHGSFTWRTLVAIPLAVLLQFVLLIGLSLFLSALNVMMRDVERFIRLAQRILFYCAPIVYPLSKVRETDKLPDWAKTLYEANPLVGIFELQHVAWVGQGWPPASLLITSATGCLIILLFGAWSFRKLEPSVLKEL
ncbi:ABC-2 type transport system permease protein [Allocatelliglobosispora scoriae]|uniref:Transport permease protein n=1 Tax=Allocatelliglobosispora scoriae TaxID=643052 RepID=A0A841BT80_9ACTN|nr:ABC-2 type transport system permease protein [Allocatelliglobosispora scoriae]